MKKLLLILLCMPLIGFGQNVYIPDANFKAYLVGNMAINTNGDTEIQVSEANSFNGSIIYQSQNISDLTGIEDFIALTVLYCDSNQLTSLDVSQNTALTTLYCSYNQLTSLDVSQNTALTVLHCRTNQLISLDVSQNTALTSLDCYFNQLISLDVSQNTALTSLQCNSTQITSLDVSQNTALTTLYCGGNQLTSLDVSQNTALTSLFCSDNLLTSLDVSTNTALSTILQVGGNQLTSLDVSTNTALTQLFCNNNQLTSLDISTNTMLFNIICWNNQITSLDVSSNTLLLNLECQANQLTSLDLRNGNNIAMGTNFNCIGNPNLYCINVDDPIWSTNNIFWPNINTQHYFSNNCYYGCTDPLALNYDTLATIDDGSCCYDCGQIQGFVYEDLDTNAIYDSISELPLGNQILELQKSNGSIEYLSTQSDGYYSFFVDTGLQVLSYAAPAYWEVSNNIIQYSINVLTDSIYSGLDFGILPESTKGDMTIDITTSNFVCNNIYTIWLTVKNLGTETITNVDIDLWLNSAQTTSIQNISNAGVISGLNHVSWNLPGDFYPFIYTGEETSLSVTIQLPGNFAIGSLVTDSARVTPTQPNLIEFDITNNYDEETNTVLCSYDPNDKQVFPEKCFYQELDTLDYTIRFQNTGNYPATTVRLVDSLDLEKLDIMSFQVLGASHDYDWSIEVPSVLEVVFDNINLVDSSVSFNESQGFFKYRIIVRDPLPDLQPTATPAFIYFDLNSAIVTNEPEVGFIDLSNTSTSNVTECDTYSWNGQNYTNSGTYSYTTTNVNSCDSTATLNLTINSSTSSLMVKTSCDSYIWLVNNQAYTNSGTYTFVSTNTNGCVHTDSLYLTIKNSTTSTTNDIACDSYTWNGQTYTTSGTYSWTGSNAAGCDSTATLNLTVSVIGTVFQVGLDLEVSVVGGNTPYSYQWNTGETTQSITPAVDGDYWVIVEDVNACISDTFYYNVNWVSTGIYNIELAGFSVYPNPSNDVFNIVFSSNTKQDIDIRIHNIIGEEIFSETLTDFSGDYNTAVDMTAYPNAIYILQINTKDGMLNRKLVLEK